MLILGLTKTTLLDYPGYVAASIFTGGCNFRCPYCHNKDIIDRSKSLIPLTDKEIFSFLNKRRNVLSGVCITGGEPTLNDDLPDFARRIKETGYRVKLDTNGTNPKMLRDLIDAGLIDYCAMDIKNSPQKYAAAAGLSEKSNSQAMHLHAINESIQLLMEQHAISYEFRTTVVAELHDESDMVSISEWIAGAQAYFIQPYVESAGVLCPGFHSHSEETLVSFVELCRPLVPSTTLRGV